jgi:mRNA-degrading endonuclease RelE of RelBE toxin-antitoxin system
MARIMVMMARRQPYTLVYAPAVKKHLQAIDAKHHALIRAKVEEQLLFEPGVETRKRKPLRQPAAFEAQWEIRFGPANRFRVLYDIDPEGRAVHILVVGEKDRDRLLIGGEEVEL